jgi:hypothetical protein
MKEKIFTLIISVLTVIGLGVNAQDIGTGVAWGALSPSEPLVLNENFQAFSFFHSDSTTDMGNSNNTFANDGVTVIYGYKNDTVEVPILGSTSGKIAYYFKQCAFAPLWKTAWAFRDGVDNTANVSNGFVEVSRDYGSTPPTVKGEFIVDLRAIDFVEVIQWSHASCGGNKRGVMLEFSLDDGTTWDTLRYQPGAAFGASFTKDLLTLEKTPNLIRCDPSAFGMTWEDGVFTENVMLRFTEAGGQVPRIHDLKVYGTYTPTTSATEIKDSNIKISSFDRKVRISGPAKVAIYNITGNLIKMVENTQLISLDGAPAGIYLVKASNGKQINVKKIIIQ